MKSTLSLIAIVLSVIALGVSLHRGEELGTAEQHQIVESTYARIERTKTIRCAYQIWPPFFNKDPNTGRFSGVYFDLMERIGKDWGVKIEWAEEVGFADMFEGFKTGRTDMFCAAVTTSPQRTAVSDFSIPIAYGPFYLYVRANDTRFDNAYDIVNRETTTMLTLDGYIGQTITKEEFPRAKTVSLPNLSTDVDVLLSIADGKADLAVCDPSVANVFMKNNPGKVRQVVGEPLHTTPFNLAFPVNEDRLRARLNTTLQYYSDTGVLAKILASNGTDPEAVFNRAKPYRN